MSERQRGAARGPRTTAGPSSLGAVDGRLRMTLGWVVPLLTGALVLGIGLAHPGSTPSGDVLTGPKPPRSLIMPRLSADYRLSWRAGHRSILLRVRNGARCRPPRPTEISTAPARIEVSLRRPTAAACTSMPRWWRYDLALPTVVEPGQGVTVWVDGMAGSVPRYQRPAAGTPGT